MLRDLPLRYIVQSRLGSDLLGDLSRQAKTPTPKQAMVDISTLPCLGERNAKRKLKRTMNSGAMIQLTMILNPTWIQSPFSRNVRCNDSYRTLHKIGYIMTSKPTAEIHLSQQLHPSSPAKAEKSRVDRPTNRHRNTHKLPLLQRRARTGHKVPQNDPHRHSKEDPDGQKPVQNRKLLEGRFGACVVGFIVRTWCRTGFKLGWGFFLLRHVVYVDEEMGDEHRGIDGKGVESCICSS